MPEGTPHTLMMAQGFVRNQGDGWTWTLDFLARTVEELAVTGHEEEAGTDAFKTYDRLRVGDRQAAGRIA